MQLDILGPSQLGTYISREPGTYKRRDHDAQYIAKRRSAHSEAYSEPCQTSKMECFAKTSNSF